ncbi:hypothetical protein AVENLUH7437_00415 [Acinetobacter venetianus]|nr:hypothetical protein AVENLUH7437_00415 [Acinetobacter venetianus]
MTIQIWSTKINKIDGLPISVIVLFLTRHKPIFLLGLFFYITQNTHHI